MTPKEFENIIRKIIHENYGDTELVHEKLDEVLCNALIEVGYKNGIRLFKTIRKWYG